MKRIARHLAAAVLAATVPLSTTTAAEVQRIEVGNRITENIPEIPAELLERLNRYEEARAASALGWLGDELVITTRFGATNQVHRVKMPNGAREQLTFYDEPVNNAVPAADGSGFVFAKDVGGGEFYQLHWFDMQTRETRMLTDGQSRNEQPVLSDDGRWLAYSSTVRNRKDSDVYVLDLRTPGAKAKRITEREGTFYPTAFSGDGKRLAFFRYVSVTKTEPYVVDLESAKETRVGDPKADAAYYGLQFAEGGRSIVYTTDAMGDFLTLVREDLATGERTPLSQDIAWDIDAFDVSPDGARVAFVANEDGFGVLHQKSLADGRELAIGKLPKGALGEIHYDASGKRVAVTFGGAALGSADAWVVGADGGEAVRWTQSEIGGLDPKQFVDVALVRFKSFDGREIPAFYYEPRGDGPFPVVIGIHGGPEGQSFPSFNTTAQYLATRGIATILPNVRGSTGYGKAYVALDNGMKREDSVKDIGALLDWIAAREELDEERVAVTGGSYGGYMVLAAMATYPDRLAAGVDVVGISNFATFLANTEDYRRDLRRAEYGDERDPAMKAFLEKISPTTNAAKIRKPLYVAQGTNDPRVPASESRQIVDTLRQLGREVWYLEFKDEGHGFQKKPNRDYHLAASMLFLETHLLKADPAKR